MARTLSIGEFSRLTHLSVKTLRHYHDVGVLPPASVDPSTGYRRYDLDQVADAHLARRLRGLDMPLAEMKAVLQATEPDRRDDLILDYLRRMERELAQAQLAV